MDFRNLHDWEVSPSDGVKIQNELRKQVRLEPLKKDPRLIAGADISYNRFSPLAYAVILVLDASTLEVVESVSATGTMRMPYVPGLLSFREIPILIEAWTLLKTDPDAIVCDGQGIAHPRRMGIASHFGLLINRPTIGCAKSILTGKFADPGHEPGDWTPIQDRGEVIGAALRTKRHVHPVYVSPGHLITLEESIRILMGVTTRYRIPEPTRQAHIRVNEVRRLAGGTAAA